jgi:protein-S-isoprenylcysteine O-methyltransferase Ste14
MTRTPVARAFRGFAVLHVVLALLIFLSASTIRYWEGWLYWILFSACGLAIMLYFLKRDPALIERRLKAGPSAEPETSQKTIQTIAIVMMLAVFLVAGLDRRLHWSRVLPPFVVLVADGFVVLGYIVIFRAFQANRYAAAVVEVSEGQIVAQTGPYRRVRHPMYSGALLLFLATPFALGSLWALIPAVALVAVVAVRLLDEERYLSKHLPGYREYCRQVRFHLIPGIW